MSSMTVYPPYATSHHTEDTLSLRRVLMAMIGFALAVSAFGLWLAPGTDPEPHLYLMKLGLSLVMLLSGASFLLAARQKKRGV